MPPSQFVEPAGAEYTPSIFVLAVVTSAGASRLRKLAWSARVSEPKLEIFRRVGVPLSAVTNCLAAVRYVSFCGSIEPERSSSSSTSRPQRLGSAGLFFAATKAPDPDVGAVGAHSVEGRTVALLSATVTSPTYARLGLWPLEAPPQATWLSARQPAGAPAGA